jgi:inner membrane protein
MTWWTTTARPQFARVLARIGGEPLLPIILIVGIYLIDRMMRRVRSVIATGVLDEPAHLATAVLVLLALVGGRRLAAAPTFTAAALAASMLIDVDHLPLYAGVPGVADSGGRPYSHSVTTVVVLLVLWLITGRRWAGLAGAAVGVCLHFVRDVATGPGLQLWWPVSRVDIRLPARWYLAAVIVLAGVATVRAVLARRRPAVP